MRQIGRDIITISAQPTMGRAFPDIRAGYYKYPTGSHVLFYRVIEGGIDVVRILRERKDFGRHFRGDAAGSPESFRPPPRAAPDRHYSDEPTPAPARS
jgi:hypothetical protein